MGKNSTIGKMNRFHTLELINGLAFLRFPLKEHGYTMDDGIVLIFEDDYEAYHAKDLLLKYFDAKEIQSLKKGHGPILNFQMGIHIHKKSDKDEDIINYMHQTDFIPITIIGGIISDIFYAHGYRFKLEISDDEIQEFSDEFYGFRQATIKNTEDVLHTIGNYEPCIRCKNDRYDNLLKMALIIREVWEYTVRSRNKSKPFIEEWRKSFKDSICHSIELMLSADEADDIRDSIKECIIKYVRNNEEASILDVNEVQEDTDLEKTILYNNDGYFVTEGFLHIICYPIIGTTSFKQLKQDMQESGVIECDKTKKLTYTTKLSIPGNRRIRCIKILKDSLTSEDGLPLEYLASITEYVDNPAEGTDTMDTDGFNIMDIY